MSNTIASGEDLPVSFPSKQWAGGRWSTWMGLTKPKKDENLYSDGSEYETEKKTWLKIILRID